MNGAVASWVPAELLVGALTLVVGALAVAVRFIAGQLATKLSGVEEATKALTIEIQAIKLAMTGLAPLTSMTAMGERITAAQQAAVAQQDAIIRTLDRDVDRLKFRLEQERPK